MEIRGVNVWATVKGTATETLADDVPGLAAELAYRFFLALFPFFIFLATLGGLVAGALDIANPAGRLIELVGARLPNDAASVLEKQLRGVVESRNPGLLSFGIIGAIWAASGGFKAVMKAMNRAYDVTEGRSFLLKNLLSVGLTLLAGGFVVAAFVLIVAGEFLGSRVAAALGVGSVWQAVLTYGRWPAAIALVVVATAFLYWAAPHVDLPFKWITPGALLFTVVWALATVLFGFYVANFGSYNATYGALGGVVILLFWFYITGFILLVGAELNAVVDEQVDPERMRAERAEKNAKAARQGRGRRAPVPSAAALTVVGGEARRLGERLFIESETKVTPVRADAGVRVTRNGKEVQLSDIKAGDWVMLTLTPEGGASALDAMDGVALRTAHPLVTDVSRGRCCVWLASALVPLLVRLIRRWHAGTARTVPHRSTRRPGTVPYTVLRRKPSR